jgi:hypothetical protein
MVVVLCSRASTLHRHWCTSLVTHRSTTTPSSTSNKYHNWLYRSMPSSMRFPMVCCIVCNEFQAVHLTILCRPCDTQVGASGLIINSCGWIDGEGYALILSAIELLRVNVILVLDQERLYNDLAQSLRDIKVVKLPKSGGVVTRQPDFRRDARKNRIRDYFYGPRYGWRCFSISLSCACVRCVVTIDCLSVYLCIKCRSISTSNRSQV